MLKSLDSSLKLGPLNSCFIL